MSKILENILSVTMGRPRGAMVKALDSKIEVYEFKLQSHNNIPFGEGMNTPILTAMD